MDNEIETIGANEIQPRRWPLYAALSGLLILWEVAARAAWISPNFFPPPTVIVATLFDLIVHGELWPHLSATLSRTLIGLACGGAAGYLLGIGMGLSPQCRALADPVIAALHPTPKIALFPLFLIIFGLGDTSRIVVIALSAFFPMLINTMAGVRQISAIHFEVARNYGAGRWKTLTRVALPGSLPFALAGTRLALNVSLLLAVAVEMVNADQGLGEMISRAWYTFRIENLYAVLVVTSVLGAGSNALLHLLAARLAPWQPEMQR